MKILLDIIHPADVHEFKNFIWEMQKRGHIIKITSREKDIANRLLDAYGFEYANISRPGKNIFGMIGEFLYRGFRFYKIGRMFKPDIIMGFGGTTIAPIGKLLRIPTIIFYDTEIVPFSNFVSYPLATYVCTPDCYERYIGKHHVKYNGYKELAYLHPRRFKPNKNILKKLGLKINERFFLLRFVSWNTIDHIGKHGMNDKEELIRLLNKKGKVFITSEVPLSRELRKYKLELPLEEVHDLMAFATLVIGESPTMAAEAAVLGVPAVYISTNWRGYTNELEKKYGLVYNFNSQEKAMPTIKALLNEKNLKSNFQKKRQRMLKDKTDVTDWMIKFVENKADVR